jgi:heme-degrading monooxygenase HmoA
MSTEHVRLWEFRVRAGCEADFEAAYGPRGAWARLFALADGYLGTELLRDATVPRRYLTIDRWTEAEAFDRFRRDHGAEYARLDAQCEPWTEAETALGAWTGVG